MTSLPLHSSEDARERRLQQIREAAKTTANAQPLQIVSGEQKHASIESGYYGTPLLKPPQWTPEVPLYFFIGGAAGAAAVIALVSKLSSADKHLARDAQWIAAIGGAVSPALLIADLGVPRRFLHMLRVFKVQSPMSVGSWTLVAFSSSAAATVLFNSVQSAGFPIRFLGNAASIVSAVSGLVLATYTGVLIGATCIPVWNENVSLLPIHFATSGVASAAAILELRGHESKALHRLGTGSAAVETVVGTALERRTRANEPLHSGVSGWTMRAAGLLSGPIPLALRFLAANSKRRRATFRRAAAVCSIVGSLLTRWAWIRAGRTSAQDPKLALGTTVNLSSQRHDRKIR